MILFPVMYTHLLYGKLVYGEKEHSDWFPERSEFGNTDRKDGPLTISFRQIPFMKH